MARQSEEIYGKYGVFGQKAYDFRSCGNEGPGFYSPKRAAATRAKRTKSPVSPALPVGCLLCVILLGAALASRSSLLILSQETVALQQEIGELLDEQTELKIRHETEFSLAETEKYAIEILGMQKPAAGQIEYIDIPSRSADDESGS